MRKYCGIMALKFLNFHSVHTALCVQPSSESSFWRFFLENDLSLSLIKESFWSVFFKKITMAWVHFNILYYFHTRHGGYSGLLWKLLQISLTHSWQKFVKVTFLVKKLLKSQFDEIFFHIVHTLLCSNALATYNWLNFQTYQVQTWAGESELALEMCHLWKIHILDGIKLIFWQFDITMS